MLPNSSLFSPTFSKHGAKVVDEVDVVVVVVIVSTLAADDLDVTGRLEAVRDGFALLMSAFLMVVVAGVNC